VPGERVQLPDPALVAQLVGKLVRVAVVGRRELVDAARELAAEARDSRPAAVGVSTPFMRTGSRFMPVL